MRRSHDEYTWTEQICPTCEARPTRFLGRRGGEAHRENFGVETQIWSCGKCGLIFPDPMPFPVGGPGQHYDVDADEYFQAHDKSEKLDAAESLVKTAEQLLGRTGTLLDVGVGRGEVLIQAKEHGWNVEGIEPSEKFAQYAEQRIGAKIWQLPVENAQLEPSSVDVVILAAVLEHLYDPDAVIRSIARMLKPGGLLYLDVPNERGLYFLVGNLYNKMRGRDWCVNLAPTFSPFHVFGFSPKAVKRLLIKHGLRPKIMKVYGGRSLVPQRGGLMGSIERLASNIVTAISNLGNMGTYIEIWAEKI